VPATETRLDPTTATCTKSVADVRIGHALQLAPFCDSTGFVYVDSLFVECAFGNEFYLPLVDGSFRYSCAETVVFANGATETKDVPSAVIMTDQSWQDDFSTDCVRVTPLISAPTSAPRAATVTIMPVPVMQPSTSAFSAPIGDTTVKAEASNAPIGIIVGVTVGAVLFLAIMAGAAVLCVMLCWKPQQQRKEKKVSEQEVDHDDRLAVGEAPALPVYAAAEVMPMVEEVTDDHVEFGDRVTAKANNFPSDERSGDRYFNPDQPDAAVTFKDQAQSVVVDDGHPMAAEELI
jgi:hypothetical protein